MDETLFYVFGIALVLSAVGLSAIGLRSASFPPSGATATGSTTTTKPAPTGKATTLKLAAEPNAIAYDTTQLSGTAGQVTIDFDNPAALTHDVCLEGPTGAEIGCSDTISQGTASLAENLKPGKYTFFCSVDSHRQAGMEGTLTVK